MNGTDVVSIIMMGIGILGFLVSFPMWLWWDRFTDRHLIGLTLVLSWAALWYSAYIALIAS